jgi:carbon monoxide dehydrogenase subunit G
MRIASSFVVPAPPERVYGTFFDPELMQGCIPGCTELVQLDERHYRGRLSNQVAHVRFTAGFTAEVVETDAPRRVRAVLSGEDRRIASSIKVDASLQIAPHDDGSAVDYVMEMALWGRIGRLGEALVRRRTAEVEQQFVESFTAAARTPEPARLAATSGAPGPANQRTPPAAGATPAGQRAAVPRWRRLLLQVAGAARRLRVRRGATR